MGDAEKAPALGRAEIVGECIDVLLGIMRGLSPAEAPAYAPAAALAIAARMLAETMRAEEEKARATRPPTPPGQRDI